jgi:uncharacterized protein (TIGR00369 family)
MTTEQLHAVMPLCATLGVELGEAAPERVVLTMPWKPELCTSAGLLHGGSLMGLADSVGGLLAFLNLPDGAVGTTTIESKTNLLGAVREGDEVQAVGTVLHKGRTTIVIETECRVGEKLVSKTTQTQAVLRAG